MSRQNEVVDERVRMLNSLERLEECATSAKEEYRRENDTDAIGDLYELRGRLDSVMERMEK